MRIRVWGMALLTVLACGTSAPAGEAVAVSGKATGVLQFPKTQTICLTFETKEKQKYMICDDVTSKDIIEQLFSLGKKDAACHIEGQIARKTGEDVYLNVTRVTEGG